MSDEDERDEDREDEGAEETDAEGAEGAASSSSSSSDGEGTSAGSDDSDDDDSDSDDEAPAASASSPAAAAVAAAKAKAKAKSAASAGARLAAAKAAKAAAKAAKKQARKEEAGAATPTAAEREQEDLERTENAEAVLRESPLGRAATNAADWAQQNRQIATGFGAVVVLALVGWIGWSWWSTSQATAAGELLEEALEISSAEIVAPSDDDGDASDAGDEADAEDDARTYATIADRNDAALVAYRRVSSEYPGSSAAAWARLGEGRILLAQGENEDARTAYQAAFDASSEEPVVAWQALEGIGASYEAEQDWEHATSTYERLAALNDHAYENVANYHLARMRAARGETSEALSAFRELVDALRDANEEGGEPAFPYVLAQADERLRELDPSATGAGPRLGGGGGEGEGAPSGLEDLSPEQLQELIRRLQAQSAGGGGDAPAPE